MYETLPAAAAPETKAPQCVECKDFAVLWRPDYPAQFPLTQFGIGGKYLCQRCALVLAQQRSQVPFGPKLDDVRALIAAKQREGKP